MTKILVIDGYDEVHGAPADWKPEVNGECLGLPIKHIVVHGITYRVSAHGFSDEERRAIADGACLYVWVSNPGPHPVMTLTLSGVTYGEGEDVYEGGLPVPLHIDAAARREDLRGLVGSAWEMAKENGNADELRELGYEQIAIDMLDADAYIEQFAVDHYSSSIEAQADIVSLLPEVMGDKKP